MDPDVVREGGKLRCSDCHRPLIIKKNKVICPRCEFIFQVKFCCTRCNYHTSNRILFELHLLFARHNYLIWRKKNEK